MKRALSSGDISALSAALTGKGIKKRKVSKKPKTTSKRSYFSLAPNSLNASGAFPNKSKTVTLKYVEEINIDGAISGGITVHDFSANGLFDPNITGTGHQPMGFDQWKLIYNHYTVVSSRARLTYAPNSASSADVSYFGVSVVDAAGELSSLGISAVLEQGRTMNWAIAGITSRSGTDGDKRHVNAVEASFDMKKVFKTKASGDELSAAVTSNPAEQAYFECWSCGTGATNPGGNNYLMEIEYDVVFSEPNSLAQS